ncbi:MAG: nucleoside-diphosphate kinase [Fibrobacterota bacterium]|nr:nucleoside-diphosphate kinase [Fibrobacterota bacterium]QQS05716.1 MAG: nucleoside-diphosphate kinase [Fibrobacterota bacterium]
MTQRTFAIIKPNAVRSALVGEILRRYETARLKIVGAKLLHASSQKVAGFYAEHEGRPFFPGLVDFMSSGPILVLALEGENAIADVRALNGATDPAKAAPGTIRHAFGPTMGSNVVHSSDSPESASREISYWFSADELFSYEQKSSVADV